MRLLTISSASVAVVIRLPFLHYYTDRDFLCMSFLFISMATEHFRNMLIW